jgi:uncharacterized protein (DUF2249 family)
MNPDTSTTEDIFDARDLPCEIKRPAVIQRCLDLPVEASFVLVNQHDPAPLRHHLDVCFPGCFRWELTGDPGEGAVRIRVTKLALLPVEGTAEAAGFTCH